MTLQSEWISTHKMHNSDFWSALEMLVAESEIIIERPKGSIHPHYPELIYPLDYGYLKDTTSMDGGGIDIWCGSDSAKQIDALICTIDLTKRDSEIKVLIGCTEEEKAQIYRLHNKTEFMKGVLIRRPTTPN